jgi:hypothetical protein
MLAEERRVQWKFVRKCGELERKSWDRNLTENTV